MNKLLSVLTFVILLIAAPALSQSSKRDAQIQKLDFCGPRYHNLDKIKERLLTQFAFLKVAEHDTIVDIGAQSGVYEGAFTALSDFKELHFVLVDIDSACLNTRKVSAVNIHFAALKPGYVSPSFSIVINTPDSLWMPKEKYNKVWIFNTLHEIPDQSRFLRQVNDILRVGGEVVIQEIIPNKPNQKHGGCQKPLIPLDRLQELFTNASFQYQEKKDIKHGRLRLHMVRFIKTGRPL